jgi:hypothetical protein
MGHAAEPGTLDPAGRSEAGTASEANSRAPAPSGSTETAEDSVTGSYDDFLG